MNGAQVRAYSKSKDGEKKLSANFKVKEFACSDGTDPVFISDDLVRVLQAIRGRCGKPVNINSGYRTVAKNKAVGGAAYSQHQYGTAADIHVAGYTPKKLAALAREIMPDYGGVGIYSWGIHVDVRAAKTDWNG